MLRLTTRSFGMTLSKRCTRCGESKPLSEFWVERRRSDGRKGICAACSIIASRVQYRKNPQARVRDSKEWRKRNLERANATQSARITRRRLAVIAGYGGKCICCGESDEVFLTVEHVNGGGRQHRKGRCSDWLYKLILDGNFPPEYTILCMNCNWATRKGKPCPHKTRTL